MFAKVNWKLNKKLNQELKGDYGEISANGKSETKHISEYPIELQEYWMSIKPFDPNEEKRITSATYTTGRQRRIQGTEKRLRGDW